MKIVVLGGTGLIGRKLVERLSNQRLEVAIGARSSGVDLATGEGLEEVLKSADIVVDVSNPGYSNASEMVRFFAAAGRNLMAAAQRADVGHIVTLSAVGANILHGGYFAAKRLQETILTGGSVPWTIVRSAPFFEFIYDGIDEAGDAEAIRVPPVQMQPIAGADVATALSGIVTRPPVNVVTELVGPDRYLLPDLALEILTANEDPRRVIVDPEALYFGARFENEPLTGGDHPRFGPTSFESWLRAWIASGSGSRTIPPLNHAVSYSESPLRRPSPRVPRLDSSRFWSPGLTRPLQ